MTGSGTANTVPLFTGSSAVGNSPIAVSGSNVGIGTATPRGLLDVGPSGGTGQGIRQGSYLEINSLAGYNNSAYLSINAVQSGTGMFTPIYSAASWAGAMVMTQYGGGYGSIDFMSHVWDNNATPVSIANFTEVMHLDQDGEVGIGTAAPWAPLSIFNATGNNTPLGGSNVGLMFNYSGSDIQGRSGSGGSLNSNLYLNLFGGSVGIGTAAPGAKLEVDGGIKLTAGSNGSITFQDGTTQTTAFLPANCGADLAESVDVTGDRSRIEPGDVMVIDPDSPGKFLKATAAYSTLVSGIYSTKPGFVGRKQPAADPASKDEVPMAMVGRVPTKVTAENGPIKVGDLLVTSSRPGYAMRGTDRSQMLGAVIGKALGPLDSGTGMIEVLVTLQ